MHARILLVALTCFLLCAQAAAGSDSAVIPALADLRHDAAQAQREGKPLVLFFSMPGCAFCHVVRQNYLLPLLRSGASSARPIIREVDITSTQPVNGLGNRPTTQRSVANEFHVRVAPTVLFVGESGRLLAQPIVGGDVAGFYGGYLDNAFAQAAQQIADARRMRNQQDGR